MCFIILRRDADEERERGYRFEMEIRTLQKELEEEKLKTQVSLLVRLLKIHVVHVAIACMYH